MKLNSDKSAGDEKVATLTQAHKMLLQLRFFLSNMETSLIESTYFNNQIMFLKCLNNIIYL